ncbi:hypothetical protein GCM10014719_70720 [Planomonospora parontospora subsp. antibiotica]|nr:hypothetical protein GCM10014719_70720 [Planomonospora parontospora subsp. antibiotica]GII20293.1 hypothetical protein Ppa05_70190 [Planomonospora parontospora subsp. antibiotica]
MAERTARQCLSLPSNRLGIYLALRHWCAPGQRLLMSPISADEIFFLVLAAGLHPVLAPVSPCDGNIDTTAVDLDAVDAVLTSNLYGLPDDVRKLAGKPLIEDVAHAMDVTVDGRPLGTFGVAGVFSFSKHAAAGAGGALVVEDRNDLRALEKLRDELLQPGSLARDIAAVSRSLARQAALRSGLVRPALRLARAFGMEEERDGYRIGLRADDLAAALGCAPALAPFDLWARADLHAFRRRPGPVARWHQSRRLERLPQANKRRIAGVQQLAALPAAARAVRGHLEQPIFRVPLLVEDRDAAVAALERAGITTGYIYDPPYDDYAGPRFVQPSPTPETARWWSRHVLPVDPLQARRALPIVERLQPAPLPR